ncbi:S8 family serine peptidase [Geobacter grbiciae]|uniref:S8 family serine peptidase n=1 Tax=Geobacter grbiciae TaxID=155042 RepID=UPI001C0219B0|nr:S8 family serine peptidase [Geobacter grbiciae]MBT1076894.1 S8 family serine peptidase [Geobacter grbiciae]
MTEKRRYLVGCRSGAVVPREVETALESLAAAAGAKPLRALKGGQRVLEMTREEAEKLASRRPDLIVEEDRELELYHPMPGLPPAIPKGPAVTMRVKVTDEAGTPVAEATVIAAGKEVSYRGKTDAKGVAKVIVHERFLPYVIASPSQGFWSRLVPSVTVSAKEELTVTLKKLPVRGGFTWGHGALGVDRISKAFTGKGVKIAVIDSGIADHEDLTAGGGFNTLDGQDPAAWNVDEKGHGTHCAGIMAARADNRVGIRGVAPGAEVYSLKVFPSGRFSDLLEAVNWCIDNYIDVISMSLGSPWPSEQVALVLAEAHGRGITCVAAAGNDGGAVGYPAAFPEVIAVSAIGRIGTFPSDSAHALKISDYYGRDGRHFFASFSNWGPEIAVCAPGVAIPSTVPDGYAAWDGTSMACPFIAGVAALILEAYPEIRTGDVNQPLAVRDLIQRSAVDLGLPTGMQGAGMASAARALGAALLRRRAGSGPRMQARR